MYLWRMMGAEMKKLLRTPNLRSQKGIALLETVPLIVIFAMLLSFGLGMFGIIHTAVLHSIAARAYSFETFRQRTNLYYFREDGSGLKAAESLNFTKKGWRYQAVQSDVDKRRYFIATTRPISIATREPAGDMSGQANNVGIYQMGARNDRISVSPAWIMVGYGICLNANCGGK